MVRTRLRAPVALVVSNVAASVTTYLFFVLAVRGLPPSDLGRFSLCFVVYPLVTQLADGGLGSRTVRDARTTPARAGSLVRRATARRVLATLLLGVVTAVALRWSGLDVVDVLLFLVVCLTSTLYSCALMAEQAAGSNRSVFGAQMLNSAAFLLVAVAGVKWGMTTVREALTFLVVAFILASAGAWFRARAHLSSPRAESPPDDLPNDARPMFWAVVANIVSGGAPSVILGSVSPVTLAKFAVADRPTQGVSALAGGLQNFLLPKTSAGGTRTHQRLLRLTELAVVPTLLVFAVASFVLVPALRWLSGDNAHLVDPWTVFVLLLASAITLLAVVTGTVLLSSGGTRALYAGAVVQGVVVVAGSVVAAAFTSVLIAAISVLVARLLTFGLHTVVLRRNLRGVTAGTSVDGAVA